MAASLALDTNDVRYVQCSSRTVFVIRSRSTSRVHRCPPPPLPFHADLDVAAQDEPPAYRWRWVVLAIVLCAEVMDLLDCTIITIAAPTVRDELGGSTAHAVVGRRLHARLRHLPDRRRPARRRRSAAAASS